MYAVAPAADAGELHVTGRGRGIREIDLCAVLNTPEDRALLALITSFDLSHNSIARLQHLDALAALTRLNASHNQIAGIGALPLTITRLDLSHNRLAALDGIGALPQLRELDVSHNRLQVFAGLSSSQPLQVLRADANRITGLGALGGMAQLRVLGAEGNRIESAGELLAIVDLPALEVLSLRGNAVAGAKGYRTLVARLQRAVLSLDGAPLLREEEAKTPRAVAAPEILAVIEDEEAMGGVAVEREKEGGAVGEKDPAMGAALAANGSTRTAVASGKRVAPAAGRSGRETDTTGAAKSTTTRTAATRALAQSAAVRKNPVISETTSTTKTVAPQRAMRQASTQSLAHKAQSVAEPIPSSNAHGKVKTHTYATSKGYSNANGSAADDRAANAQENGELRESHVLIAELGKENAFLRNRIRTVEAQLHDARRVVSSQLDEMNALRQQVADTEGRETALRERLDRTTRGARAAERRSHAAAEALTIEHERMRAAYDAQIADLQQQLRRCQRGGGTAMTQTHTFDKTRSVDKTAVSSRADGAEVEAVLVEPSAGALAGELKEWLYAEMAEDARRVEENPSLQQLRESLAHDEATLQEPKVSAAGADGASRNIPRL